MGKDKKVKKSKLHSQNNFRNNRIINLLLIFSIVIISLIVYSNSINNEFIPNWDDSSYVESNTLIKDLSKDGLSAIFTEFSNSNYHPLTLLSYAIEYKLFGLSPKPYHITNLILHILNSILVFMFMLLVNKKRGIAFISALLFAIHPMHVESVSWISERKDVLFTFFYLSGLICYWYYLTKDFKIKYLLFTLVLFVLSFLSKSAAITFPAVMLLMDYLYKRKKSLSILLDKGPFLILTIIFGVIAYNAQKAGGALDIAPEYGLLDRVFLLSYSLSFYILKLFAPYNLSALHFYPDKVDGLLPWEFYASPIFLIALIVLILVSKNIRRMLIFGFLFFLITISVTLQIFPFGQAIVAERYTYIPYIGLLFIVGAIYTRISSKKIKTYFSASLVVFVIILSITTWNRNKVWKSGKTLFSDVIEKYPDKPYGYYNRAMALHFKKDNKGSISDLKRALKLNPEFTEAYHNLGVSLYAVGNLEEALLHLNKAIELNSLYGEAYHSRGIVKNGMAEYKSAIADFNKAVELVPDDYIIYTNRATVRSSISDIKGAINDYEKALTINPNLPNAHHNCGTLKCKLEKYKEAIAEFNNAIRLNPNYASAYYNRGIAKYFAKDYYGACNDWIYSDAIGYKKAHLAIDKYCR